MNLRLALLGKALLGDEGRDEQQSDQRPGHARGRQKEVMKVCWCHAGILTNR